MYVTDIGSITTWTNARSCAVGLEGNGLNIAWRQGLLQGTTTGPTHIGGFATSGLRQRVFLARVYGEAAYFGGLPRHDYVYIEHLKNTDGTHKFNVKVWKNTGEHICQRTVVTKTVY